MLPHGEATASPPQGTTQASVSWEREENHGREKTRDLKGAVGRKQGDTSRGCEELRRMGTAVLAAYAPDDFTYRECRAVVELRVECIRGPLVNQGFLCSVWRALMTRDR
jgi:hypothetical protein